ncbi:hypothetical protein ACTXG6_18725 [Pseudonocardia sp. Cha107L01]|uniref:hypothetical protein n=1 Tax=Pseudonocardia sp. Cha107L01 TaxID=3457576 RepID=UPI00403E8D75
MTKHSAEGDPLAAEWLARLLGDGGDEARLADEASAGNPNAGRVLETLRTIRRPTSS